MKNVDYITIVSTAHFIAINHYWTRYWLGRPKWPKNTELVESVFL